MTSRVALLLMAWVALLASPVASGQTTTATLSGVIRDATGAVVPEARIRRHEYQHRSDARNHN
jgi:hypothetical protein